MANTIKDLNGKQVSMTGERNAHLSSSEIAGVVGGVLAAVVAYSEGSNVATTVATAVVGGACGYAFGNLISPVADLTTGTKVIGGVTSLSFGLSCGGLTTVVGNAFGNLNKPE